MEWLRKMFGRGERDRKSVQLAKLEAETHLAQEEADRVLRERQRIIEATRGTVRVIRRDGPRRV